MAQRLVRLYRAATEAMKAAGRDWYRRARVLAWDMATECGVTLRTAAGVIAALSPRLQWVANVRAARRMLQGTDPSGVFKASKAKARRIIAGESPEAVLSGPKVRAFFDALCGNDAAAVVDVWIARAVGLDRVPTDDDYRRVALALRLARIETGERVAQLQAIAWVQVRGRA